MRTRRKRYSAEFKRQALLKASEDGMTDKALCEELGISTRQLRRWRDVLRLQELELPMSEGENAEQELRRLKRELKRVTEERDFLRDAAVYFAKESKRGTSA